MAFRSLFSTITRTTTTLKQTPTTTLRHHVTPNSAVATTLRHHTTDSVSELKIYPYLNHGREAYYGFSFSGGSFFFRVDMQGISQKELKLWAENQEKVCFQGEDTEKHKFEKKDTPTRLYKGSFGVDPKTFDTGRVQGKVEDGVLTVEVPRWVALPEGAEPTLGSGEWIEIHLQFTRIRVGN